MTMPLVREHLQHACCAMAALALVLLLLRRRARSSEWRILLLEIPIFLATLVAGVEAFEFFRAPADLLVAVLLVEIGILIRVFDARRGYRSASGTLRTIGGLYILAGLACGLSQRTGFSAYWWLIPLGLFSCGYFFLRARRGAANLCKGLGVLVTVGFIASMLYDLQRGGASARWGPGPFGGGLLPEVVRPSFVMQLDAMNEKIASLQADRKRLAEDLRRSQAERRELEAKVGSESSSRTELERKAAALEKAAAAADDTIRRLKAENEEARARLNGETEARIAAERKLDDLDKLKTAAKEGVAATTKQLTDAAENLKKAVAERDAVKAELDALKAARPAAGVPAPGAEAQALARQVGEKEEQRVKLAAEVERLQETLEKVREAIAAAPVPTERPGN